MPGLLDRLLRRFAGFEFATIVTSFHAAGYEAYGRRFVESFEQKWPLNYRLLLYLEGMELAPPSTRVRALDLHASIPALVSFKERHAANTAHCGRPAGGAYDYRFDAVKFANKAFALAHAARNCRTRLLVWLDADTVTLRNVPANWIRDVLGEEAFVAYLGRARMHTETGFLAFDLGRRHAREFFEAYEALYTSDEIFNLREWHDCEAFDTTRALFSARGQVVTRNLSPDGTMHPFVNSRIGEYLDHLKGPVRKRAGRSQEADYSYFRGVQLPPPPANLEAGRYAYLPWLIRLLAPRSIVEVGTWSGHRALQMASVALSVSPTVRYSGFDLFEEATADDDAREKNVKAHYSQAQVDALLARFAASHPGFDYELTAGNTRNSLPQLSEDFAFIDGGHSVETIRSDFERLRGCRTVVLDDWYEGPIDISRFGCNQVIEGLPRLLLPHADPIAGGGTTRLAVVAAEPVLERLRGALSTAPHAR